MWISRCIAEWIGFTFCRLLDRPYAFKAQRVKAAGGHIRVSGGKRARGSKSDPRDQCFGGSFILGEKLVIFLGSKIFWMQSPMKSLFWGGGKGALVHLRFLGKSDLRLCSWTSGLCAAQTCLMELLYNITWSMLFMSQKHRSTVYECLLSLINW